MWVSVVTVPFDIRWFCVINELYMLCKRYSGVANYVEISYFHFVVPRARLVYTSPADGHEHLGFTCVQVSKYPIMSNV